MTILLLAFVLAAQDATMSLNQTDAAAIILPRVETAGSPSFALPQPRVRAKADAVRIEGTICRRANRSLISPSRLQMDHRSAYGDIVTTQFAYVPRLSQREDQRCGHYGALVKPPFEAGDIVRICLPRSGIPCGTSR